VGSQFACPSTGPPTESALGLLSGGAPIETRSFLSVCHLICPCLGSRPQILGRNSMSGSAQKMVQLVLVEFAVRSREDRNPKPLTYG